ncbi:MAG TPA: transaldolase family protein, partial [Thermoanaerobaculia bacterium]|nr:transaldolase family protein [Thermoanaerobaculia bacterium]
MSNPLAELEKVGQSVWYDQMERRLVSSGKLQKMIDEDDLRGLTSNPTIFEKAIAGSEDYDAQLNELASQNKSRAE